MTQDNPETWTPPYVERVNGFAQGDRVAIVDGPFKGAFGKVYYSSIGCHPVNCVSHCYLVHVELQMIPKGIAPSDMLRRKGYRLPLSDGTLEPQTYRFTVHEVTHAD